MRILFANNLYGIGSRGGAESVVLAEAGALAGMGHDVAVVSIGRDGLSDQPAGMIREFRYEPPNLFSYRDLGRHGYAARFAWHLLDIFNAGSARMFREIVDGFQPDVVHTHNLMGLGFLIPAELRSRGVRHVHTVHDVQLLHPSGLLPVGEGGGLSKLSFAARAYARVTRRMFGSPDAIVFPSDFMRAAHLTRGFFSASRSETVRNPAPAAVKRTDAPASPVFLYAGQLERHKGVATLLDAWKSEDIGARLVVCGAGRLGGMVKAAAERPDVGFPGRMDASALLDEIGHASFTVVPSEVIENAPAVIMESFSRGTPVIASRSGGIPELVREGETGFLFEAGDAEALAAALRSVSKMSADEWLPLSARCLEVSRSCGIDKHLNLLLETYSF